MAEVVVEGAEMAWLLFGLADLAGGTFDAQIGGLELGVFVVVGRDCSDGRSRGSRDLLVHFLVLLVVLVGLVRLLVLLLDMVALEASAHRQELPVPLVVGAVGQLALGELVKSIGGCCCDGRVVVMLLLLLLVE